MYSKTYSKELARKLVKIRNKDPKTGNGEIIAKSPSVMLGYYKDEKQTAEGIEDGCFLLSAYW